LAEIADKQHDLIKAQEYRRLSRETLEGSAGAQYLLQKHGQLIAGVVAAVDDAQVRKQLEPVLEEITKRSGDNLVAAIDLILDGERDENMLSEPLGGEDTAIINAILRGIADPETLKPLLEGQDE
jgi:hypothetical protein